jgi:NAD(P)-dependent dehydrogenase (short-subunit alcohol dehydrogenase family)
MTEKERKRQEKLVPLSKSLDLKGKTALISGASSGIGKAMAHRFAEAGAHLVLIDVDEAGLCNTRDDLAHFSESDKRIHKVDLCHKIQIDALWEKLQDNLPDIIVNNAGIYPFQDFLEVNAEFLERVMNINLNSVFWMCQNFIKRRKTEKKGGIIVNVSSIEALLPFKEDLVQYSVSKIGVIALTRSLARDYGKKGFRANVILPGAVKTPGTSSLAKDAIVKFRVDLIKTGYDFQQRLALGRWGDPDEIAKVALFLSSDLASYVQGAMLPVDGGFLST